MAMEMDIDKSDDELDLERLVFGDSEGIKERIQGKNGKKEKSVQETNLEHLEDDQLFFIDAGEQVTTAVEAEDEQQEDVVETGAAWYDSDDENLTISLATTNRLRKLRETEDEDTVSGKVYTRRLRQQFERIYPVPDWAKPIQGRRRNSQDDEDDNDDIVPPSDPLSVLFQSSAPLTQRPTSFLPEDILAITAVASLPMAEGHSNPLALHFHPSYPLLLIGSQDNTLRIHSIDGKHNPLATSLKLARLTIHSALFHPTKNLVYATGLHRKGIFVWDLNSGNVNKIAKTLKEESMASGQWSNLKIAPNGALLGVMGARGWLCLLSTETGQYLGGCKVEGPIADYTFTRDGSKVIIITVGGEVWEFGTAKIVVENRWRDQGGVSLTKVALSSNDRFLAIGSLSGIVTIYDMTSGSHSPARTLYNLTTPITSLRFSPDGQMLVMASSSKRDQLRVVHIPSLKVFPNWPTAKTPLGLVACLDVGDNGYLAVGRRKGVALWRVRE